MVRTTEMVEVLRDGGYTVEELPGWRGRGREMVSIDGIVEHFTATFGPPIGSEAATSRLLVDGRVDLTGPLSQLGLRRDAVFVAVADGKCNHNGFGLWGNQSLGIEAYNNNRGEEMPTIQYEAMVGGTALLAQWRGFGTDRIKGHRETNPTRKSDPLGIDMNRFRRHVGDYFIPEFRPVLVHIPIFGSPVLYQGDNLIRLPFQISTDKDGNGYSLMPYHYERFVTCNVVPPALYAPDSKTAEWNASLYEDQTQIYITGGPKSTPLQAGYVDATAWFVAE